MSGPITKELIRSIRSRFLNQWVMKKSKMPFGQDGKVVGGQLTRIDYGANKIYADFIHGLEIGKIDCLEIVSPEVVQQYQRLFDDSSVLSSSFPSDRAHLTESGQPKRGFKPHDFQTALYWLKLKYPKHNCCAYICPECNQTHLGKTNDYSI